MEQVAALKEGKSCLSITAAFDPFDFIDKALHHAVAPTQTASVGMPFARKVCRFVPERFAGVIECHQLALLAVSMAV